MCRKLSEIGKMNEYYPESFVVSTKCKAEYLVLLVTYCKCKNYIKTQSSISFPLRYNHLEDNIKTTTHQHEIELMKRYFKDFAALKEIMAMAKLVGCDSLY